MENTKTSALVLMCVNKCQAVAAGVILLKMHFVFKIRIKKQKYFLPQSLGHAAHDYKILAAAQAFL